MQLSYVPDADLAYAGMPYDAMYQDSISKAALELLNFGYAAFRSDDTNKPNSVRGAKRNSPTLVWTGDFVASNVINGTVNGVAIAPVTYATSQLVTVTALGDAIVAAALAQGIVATYVLSNSNHTITLLTKDSSTVLASFVVTGGAGQVTATITAPTTNVAGDFVGVLRAAEATPARSVDGLNGYSVGDATSIIRKGRVWVPITATVLDGAPAYVDMTVGSEGKFTSVSAGNIGPVGTFFGAAAATGISLGVLDINLP